MQGPGDVRVVNQSGSDGQPIPLGTAAEIDRITVGGTNAELSTLVGRVQQGPNGDGKVFFKRLEAAGQSVAATSPAGNGLQAIDMPGFWLGNTSPAGTTAAGTPPASIAIPDGVDSLRLGGVDASRGTTPGVAPPGRPGRYDPDHARPPAAWAGRGSSSIRSSPARNRRPRRAASPRGSCNMACVFNVSGRLSLFQADAIVGDPDNPGGQFPGGGGTVVTSLPDQNTGITGQIGDVRVGGDATNFSVLTNDKLANFYIGGETRNVFLLTPTGSRNLHFGKGWTPSPSTRTRSSTWRPIAGPRAPPSPPTAGSAGSASAATWPTAPSSRAIPRTWPRPSPLRSVTENPSAQSGGLHERAGRRRRDRLGLRRLGRTVRGRVRDPRRPGAPAGTDHGEGRGDHRQPRGDSRSRPDRPSSPRASSWRTAPSPRRTSPSSRSPARSGPSICPGIRRTRPEATPPSLGRRRPRRRGVPARAAREASAARTA